MKITKKLFIPLCLVVVFISCKSHKQEQKMYKVDYMDVSMQIPSNWTFKMHMEEDSMQYRITCHALEDYAGVFIIVTNKVVDSLTQQLEAGQAVMQMEEGHFRDLTFKPVSKGEFHGHPTIYSDFSGTFFKKSSVQTDCNGCLTVFTANKKTYYFSYYCTSMDCSICENILNSIAINEYGNSAINDSL